MRVWRFLCPADRWPGQICPFYRCESTSSGRLTDSPEVTKQNSEPRQRRCSESSLSPVLLHGLQHHSNKRCLSGILGQGLGLWICVMVAYRVLTQSLFPERVWPLEYVTQHKEQGTLLLCHLDPSSERITAIPSSPSEMSL